MDASLADDVAAGPMGAAMLEPVGSQPQPNEPFTAAERIQQLNEIDKVGSPCPPPGPPPSLDFSLLQQVPSYSSLGAC